MSMSGLVKEDHLQRMYDKDGRNTSSTDPMMMESRLFIGNLASEQVTRQDIEKMFSKYGKILGVSLHKSFGFVQFDNKETAELAVKSEKGQLLKGLKMATERRKDFGSAGSGPPPSRRRSHRSRSPSPSRYRQRDRFEHERYERRPSPPSRFRGPPPFDSFRDPYYSPRDPYLRPRDDPFDRYPLDPYDRYPPPPPPSRGYLRDYPPPPRRDRYDMDPWDSYPRERELHVDRDKYLPPLREERDPYGGMPSASSTENKSTEMEIIVVNNQQKEYAQMVRQRVENLGLVVNLLQLNPTVSLVEALDNAARRGLLYTVIITAQHESHRSVTLTILHGRNPQEHKNMPLDDAIGLIDRDYERYCHTIRTSGRPLPSTRGPGSSGGDVSGLMARAAAGDKLSSIELNTLITSLQQKHNKSQSGVPSRSSLNTRAPTSATAEDIQQQQADLQAKILSLLGSSAVVPPTKPTSTTQSSNRYGLESHGYSGYDGYHTNQTFGGYR